MQEQQLSLMNRLRIHPLLDRNVIGHLDKYRRYIHPYTSYVIDFLNESNFYPEFEDVQPLIDEEAHIRVNTNHASDAYVLINILRTVFINEFKHTEQNMKLMIDYDDTYVYVFICDKKPCFPKHTANNTFSIVFIGVDTQQYQKLILPMYLRSMFIDEIEWLGFNIEEIEELEDTCNILLRIFSLYCPFESQFVIEPGHNNNIIQITIYTPYRIVFEDYYIKYMIRLMFNIDQMLYLLDERNPHYILLQFEGITYRIIYEQAQIL